MAIPNTNWSEITTTTLYNRSQKLADNVTKNNALLRRLSQKSKIKPFDGGQAIVQEIEYSENGTFKRYSGYDVLSISPSDVFTSAQYPIAQAGSRNLHLRPGNAAECRQGENDRPTRGAHWQCRAHDAEQHLQRLLLERNRRWRQTDRRAAAAGSRYRQLRRGRWDRFIGLGILAKPSAELRELWPHAGPRHHSDYDEPRMVVAGAPVGPTRSYRRRQRVLPPPLGKPAGNPAHLGRKERYGRVRLAEVHGCRRGL